MRVAGLSDVGLVRTSNQDCSETVFLSDNTVVSVVCDGMGGANGGNIASEMSVDTVVKFIRENYRSSMSSNDIENMLNYCVYKANKVVYETAKKKSMLTGMGTTLVIAFVRNNEAYILNVGDSRAYLIDEKNINRITTDHSVVQELLQRGEITSEDALSHPQKHIITRAIGIEYTVEADLFDFVFEDNQIIFLCTDGMTNHASDEEIFDIVVNSDFEDIPQQAINFAKINGGSDNITVSVIAQ